MGKWAQGSSDYAHAYQCNDYQKLVVSALISLSAVLPASD